MSSQYGELRPTSGWDRLTSLGYPCKFQLVSRLGSVTVWHLVVGVSQTLRRWTEGATYIRQGDHQVGHWPTFLVCKDKFKFARQIVRWCPDGEFLAIFFASCISIVEQRAPAIFGRAAITLSIGPAHMLVESILPVSGIKHQWMVTSSWMRFAAQNDGHIKHL